MRNISTTAGPGIAILLDTQSGQTGPRWRLAYVYYNFFWLFLAFSKERFDAFPKMQRNGQTSSEKWKLKWGVVKRDKRQKWNVSDTEVSSFLLNR